MFKNLKRNGSLKIGSLFIFLLLFAGCQTTHEFGGASFSPPRPVPDLALESIDGPVSLHDFKGKYTLVYFGYTFCPDICPTTLAMFKTAKEELGENADQVEMVMITVDPERDTPEQLAEYMTHFDSAFVGLSGDKETIDLVGEPFGLFYEKREGSEATGYLVDHTAYFYLLDRDSKALVAYPHETLPDVLVQDLEYLIRNDS
jgi:protein SCO1/2